LNFVCVSLNQYIFDKRIFLMSDLIQFKHIRFSDAEQSRVIFMYFIIYNIYIYIYVFLHLINFIADGQKPLKVMYKSKTIIDLNFL